MRGTLPTSLEGFFGGGATELALEFGDLPGFSPRPSGRRAWSEKKEYGFCGPLGQPVNSTDCRL